jgi:hypothetical protein
LESILRCRIYLASLLSEDGAYFFGVMLLVLLFIVLSAGSDLQAHAQVTFAYVSLEQPDPPDAASPSPTPQQKLAGSVPFLSPLVSRPIHPMDLGGKFKYLVEPAFGPRAFVATASAPAFAWHPPARYPHEWRAGTEAFGRYDGDSFARAGAERIGRFSAAVLLHEDSRYRRSESSFFPARLGHAFVFTFVDRTDGDQRTVAISNFTGAAAGGFYWQRISSGRLR